MRLPYRFVTPVCDANRGCGCCNYSRIMVQKKNWRYRNNKMKKPGFLVVALMLFNHDAMKLLYFLCSATLCSRTLGFFVSGVARLKMGGLAYWRNYIVVQIWSAVGVAPKETVDVHEMLFKTADYLTRGGETGIFSPMHMILCRKPEYGEMSSDLSISFFFP